MTKPKGEKPARESAAGPIWAGQVAAVGEMRLMPLGPADGRGSYWQTLGPTTEWEPANDVERQLAALHLARLLKAGDQRNEGAQDERDAMRAYLSRALRNLGEPGNGYDEGRQYALTCALKWLEGRPDRFGARPGGLKSPRRGPGKGARRAQ